jgi:RNA polymerase sigma-70 factor (ECF subfamily)
VRKGVIANGEFRAANPRPELIASVQRQPLDPMGLPVSEHVPDTALIDLMIAYQAGDLSGFEQLYAALAEDARRYFVRAVRDPALANDLVQDLFLEIHRARRTYSPPLPVRPWVFGIARNILARSRRAMRARPASQVSLDAELDIAVAPAVCAPSPESLDVGNAIATLPAGTRDAWFLHHVLGFSFHAIAERLGVTVVAAKLRSSRAMQALRAALGGEPRGRDD